MAKPSIEVEGLNELRKALRQAKDKELNETMREIHRELAREIVQRALPNVPVKTGKLKATVRAAGTIRDAIGRAGKATVPYAPPIHWGWPKRNIKPNPFLVDAAETIERDIVDRYDKAVSDMLNRLVR